MNQSWICNKYCNTVTNSNLKKEIIDYLYNNVKLHEYRFVILKNDNINILDITEEKYYLTVNVTQNKRKNECLKRVGEQYYLIIFNNNSYLINKKELFYNRNKVDINKIKINNICLNFNNCINNTIFDGSTVYTKQEQWIFLVNDIYLYKNSNISKIDFKEKKIIFNFINSNIINNENNLFNLDFNPIINLKNIRFFIQNMNNYDYHVSGITFLPKNNGERVIYRIYKNKNNSNNNINNNFSSIIESNKNINNTNEVKFELKTTNLTDVYVLYNIINNKKNKVDIARIPNKEISIQLYNYFKNNSKNTMNVLCKYSNKFKKYNVIKLLDNC